MVTVVLAEKPSQALAYASAFQSSKKHKGYFEVTDRLLHDETFITFGFGHLVGLAEPKYYKNEWEKWSLESLPIFPEEYHFVVADDKKEQFKIVKGLLSKADTIIIATDCDREGENIAWSIIYKSGVGRKEFKRLWINSLEEEAIREGFKNLKNGLDYLPFFKEAQTRQIADWLIGMNASPLYSLELQKKGVSEVFSVGRVQTPTLYMIYQRYLSIKDFTKEIFFEIVGQFKTETGEKFKAHLHPNQRFNNIAEATAFLQQHRVLDQELPGRVKDISSVEKKVSSPRLFSLSMLQTRCNKDFKISSKQTLDIAQSLYEKRLLTYPRTDSPFITSREFDYLKSNFKGYCELLNIDGVISHSEARKRYVDDGKVQEHHAIILTKKIPTKETIEGLSDLERKVYFLILKTTLAMFFDDHVFLETTINLSVNDLMFQAKGQTKILNGWKDLFNSTKEQESMIPKMDQKMVLRSLISSEERETTPPSKYTEGTLITAMKTAGKHVDNKDEQAILNEVEGIGTEATRAGIIETLKAKKYIVIEQNKVEITEKGILLCQAIEKQNLLKSPEMTAKWESYLKKIGKNENGASQGKFLENIKKFVNHLISSVGNDLNEVDFQSYKKAAEEEEEKTSLGTCPKCKNGSIKAKNGFYGCSAYPDCRYTLPDNFRGKKLTAKNVKDILKDNITVINKVKKKGSKETYNATVKQSEKGFLEFVSFER